MAPGFNYALAKDFTETQLRTTKESLMLRFNYALAKDFTETLRRMDKIIERVSIMH